VMWESRLDLSGSGHGQFECFCERALNLRVPWKEENFMTRWDAISFSRRTRFRGVLFMGQKSNRRSKFACLTSSMRRENLTVKYIKQSGQTIQTGYFR